MSEGIGHIRSHGAYGRSPQGLLDRGPGAGRWGESGLRLASDMKQGFNFVCLPNSTSEASLARRVPTPPFSGFSKECLNEAKLRGTGGHLGRVSGSAF